MTRGTRASLWGGCTGILGILLLLLCAPLATADFTGPVISVLDDDTIEVLCNTHPERIRISGIDCPEKRQPFGTRAKKALSGSIFGKAVILQTHGQDKYRRTLADILLPDGTNINHELVRGGWCWWYRRYAPMDTALEVRKRSARGEERLVGRSEPSTAVGVAKKKN